MLNTNIVYISALTDTNELKFRSSRYEKIPIPENNKQYNSLLSMPQIYKNYSIFSTFFNFES